VSEFWTWFNFGVVAAMLGYLAVRMGGPALRNRAADILESLSGAAERSETAAASVREVEALLAGLADKAAAIRREALEEMAREAERFERETRHLIAKVEANAQAEIEAAAKHARAELEAYSGELALGIAQKKVAARMTPGTQALLVDQFVRSLS